MQKESFVESRDILAKIWRRTEIQRFFFLSLFFTPLFVLIPPLFYPRMYIYINAGD